MHRIALRPKEQVLQVYRQAEIILAKPVLIELVALYIPWYLTLRYGLVAQFRFWLFLWTIAVIGYAIREYFIWSRNQYVITSDRLIQISHKGFFKKAVVETPLERILNVSYKTTGIISALFGYGDVEVQVVGLIEPVILRRIKQPQEMKDYIWQLHQAKAAKETYTNIKIPRIQENDGYTKSNQKVI